MGVTVEELTKQAAALSTDQRFTLAYRILAAIEPPPTVAIEEAWDREIRDRIQRFRDGVSSTTPGGEVFAELDTLLHP